MAQANPVFTFRVEGIESFARLIETAIDLVDSVEKQEIESEGTTLLVVRTYEWERFVEALRALRSRPRREEANREH